MLNPIVIATARRGRECWFLEIVCPHCGQRHQHGGGDGLVPQSGHYVAHCRNSTGKGYFIELAEESEGVA
jgi:hypothetical protein